MDKTLTLPEKYGYRLLYTLLLSAVTLLGGGKYLGISHTGGWHIFAVICMVCLFTGFCLLKTKGRIFCGLFAVTLLFGIVVAFTPDAVFDFLQSYFGWLTGSGSWWPEWRPGYEIIQTLFLSFAICVAEILLEKYSQLQLILVALLFSGLVISMFTKTAVSHAGVVCSFFYIVLVCMEWIQKRWQKHRTKNSRAHTLFVMPFFLLYMILMLLMPAPKEPYDWQFVKDAYRQLQSTFSRFTDFVWGNDGDGISPALSGFSEDAYLSGSVTANTRKIMEIKGQVSLVTNIYLGGKTFDTFDGKQWFSTDENAETVSFTSMDGFADTGICADTAKTVQAVDTYGDYSARNYLSKTTLQITYTKYNSSTVFLPLKTERLRSKTDGYEAVYYQLNINAAHFYDMLAQAQAENTAEAFAGRSLYTQEVFLSDEMQTYLDEITKDATNDVEKLQLIEKELSSFTYNRAPGALPDYVTDAGSFLDYFMLESKEGFCTHFATAFVLLARAEGIPARYVQGFCVPTGGEKTITVYANMAHAWPEVYIDGVGFIPFEPTPGYSSLRYTPWQISVSDTENPGSGAGSQYRPDVNLPEEDTSAEILDEAGQPVSAFLKAVAFLLPFMFGIAIFVWVISKIMKRHHFKKMTVTEKFHIEANMNFSLLGLLGARRATNETLEDLSAKAKQLNEYQEIMTDFICLYEDVIYGQKEVTTDMYDTVQFTRSTLFDAVKRKSTVLYFFQKLHFYPY